MRIAGSFLMLGVLGLVGCVHRPVTDVSAAPAPYVRVVAQTNGVVQLEIAARRFTPRRGQGAEVWLTAASHLGDAAYYHALQAHLDARSRVLFEGVGATDSAEFGHAATAKERAAAPASSLQSQMARSLGLEFQLEAIDYDRPHFRNSDLGVTELRDLLERPAPARARAVSRTLPKGTEPGAGVPAAESVEETREAARNFERLMSVMQGGNFWSGFLNLGLRWLGTQPRYQAIAKVTLMEMLEHVQGDLESLGTLPPGLRELLRVLIEERNRKVLADLRKELAGARRGASVSIFYGAGHMHDLELRLRNDFRYVPREEVWFPAMTVNVKTSGLSAAELAATREMVRRQVQTLRGASGGSR